MLRGFAIDGKSANEVLDDFSVRDLFDVWGKSRGKWKASSHQELTQDSWACAISASSIFKENNKPFPKTTLKSRSSNDGTKRV